MFYKLIDKYTISPAPNPLRIGDEDVFTNSEETHNEQGYYRVEWSQGEGRPYYELQDNVLVQKWEDVETTEEEVSNDG